MRIKTLKIVLGMKLKIEIFEIRENICLPAADNISKITNNSLGDKIVILNEKVYAKDWDNDENAQFSLINCTPNFIHMNPNIFDRIN